MAEQPPQTLENHARFHPLFHYFLLPMAALSFLAAVWNAVRHPDFVSLWLAFGALLFVIAVFLIRTYALKVQDRVIRLEERLRLMALLPESLLPRIPELTGGQLIALRFASDSELPELAARALQQNLTPADIKKSIRSWRADYFRV